MDIERLLPYILVLFVLSQVSERISNFLKLYLPHRWFGNLDIKERNPFREKIREKKILALSLVAGAITTIIFYGGYVSWSELKDKMPENDPWVALFIEHWLATFLLFTFFLSFGAKFWHDLLDIIYLYKNAKRVVNSGEAMYADSANQVAAMLTVSTAQIAKKALAANKKKWMAIKGVVAVGIGTSSTEEPTLRIYYEEGSKAAALSEEFPWEDDTGIVRTIQLEKILSGRAVAQAAVVGGKIAHIYSMGVSGTMGFVFQDKFRKSALYTSSCYHVLRQSKDSWGLYESEDPDTVCHQMRGNECLGKSTLYKGGRTEDYDAVLCKLSTLDLSKANLPKISRSGKITQFYANLPVTIQLDNREVTGYIHEWKTDVVVHYNDGGSMKFIDFFSIRASPSIPKAHELKPVTKPGDSGSAIFSNGEALGMVVGGSDRLTYAMKITTLEDRMGVWVLPHPSSSPSIPV